MKLLVDAHVFDGKHQGTRTYIKGLYIALTRICPNWIFFFAAKDVENLKKEFGNRPNVNYLKLKSQNKFSRLLVEFPRIIKAHQIDYSHFQYIAPLIKNCKQIVTIHDILFEQIEFKKYFPLKYRIVNGFLFQLSARRADILLTVSSYSKRKISELYHVPNKNIYVTFNAVDSNFSRLDERFNIDVNLRGCEFILYVSRIEPRKNHLMVVKAFLETKIYERGIKLVFIGSKDIHNPELTEYLNLNQDVLRNKIYWLSNVPYEEIKHYYAHCSLFVFPSYAEGFGIPILEAMSFEKRILVSNQTAMKDFNLPNELSFNPNDLDELKHKINNSFLMDPKRFSKLYKRILSEYNWENSAKQMIKSINEYLESK